MSATETLHGQNETAPHKELTPKEKEDRAWISLVQTITNRAHLENIPLDQFAFKLPIDVDGEEEGGIDYEVFVNSPFLDSKGNIEIISLELYQEGEHIQHWTTKITWRQGKPRQVKIRSTPFDEGARFFGPKEIARYTENSINDLLPGLDYRGRQANGIFPIPYSFRLQAH